MSFFGDLFWRVLRLRLFDGVRPLVFRLDAYLLVGRTSWSDGFSVLVLGSKVSVEYFLKFFFVGDVRVECLGRMVLGRVVSCGRALGADLVIVDSRWLFSRFLGDEGFFVSPRVDFVLNVDQTLHDILNKIDNGKRRRLRQVINAGYTFEVTKDPAKLEIFYRELYLPHMLKKHAASALPISISECKKLFSKGELLLVKLGNELLSGCIIIPRGEELWEPLLGVKNINEGTNFTLGSYSIYYFCMLEAKRRGFAGVDFGEAPPFMSDGLFRFKRGLGMWVRPALGSGAQVFGVRFLGSSDCLRGFLSVFPFVFVEGGGLSGVVFLDCLDESSVKPFCVPGLSSLYVVSTKVSDSANINLVAMQLEDCLRSENHTLRILGQMCIKNNYLLSKVIFQ